MNSKYRSTKPVLRAPAGRLLHLAAVLFSATIARTRSILESNLIVNGNAEAGSAGASVSNVVTIPNWTCTGNVTVLPYHLTGTVLPNDPAPEDQGFASSTALCRFRSTSAAPDGHRTCYVAVQNQPCRGE